MSKTQNSSEGDNPCLKELHDYIAVLKRDYLPWYERASSRYYLYWSTCAFVSVVAGFAASVVAALINDDTFSFQPYGKTLLIILPAIGSLAATLLTQFRFEEVQDLREIGRIEMQDMIAWAGGQLAAAEDKEKCSAVYEELRKKVLDLETGQRRRVHELLRSPLKKKGRAD
jgi:hypothetical protein